MTLRAPTCFTEVKDKVGSLRFCSAARCYFFIIKRISWQIDLATKIFRPLVCVLSLCVHNAIECSSLFVFSIHGNFLVLLHRFVFPAII